MPRRTGKCENTGRRKTTHEQAVYEVVRYCFGLFDAECSRLEKEHKIMTPRWKRFRDRKSLVQRIVEWSTRIVEGEKSAEIFKEVRREFGLESRP